MTEGNKYEKGTLGWIREQAKKDGFGDNIGGWQNWKNKKKREQGWYKELEGKYGKEFADWAVKNKDHIPIWWINAGCKTQMEYNNKCAQDAGFKDFNERQREWRHETGKSIPYEFNEYCSSHVGVTIGEDVVGKPILDMMFEEVLRRSMVIPDMNFYVRILERNF